VDLSGAFNAITEIANEKRRVQDLEDLNNERSGLQTGRMQRFLTGGNGGLDQQSKKDKEDASLRTMLDIMMQDQEYAALWNEIDQDTLKAQSKVDALQDRIDNAIEQIKEDLQQTLDDAVTLPDGRKAFMHKDGVARTVDGQKIDPTLTAGIDWTGRPTYDDYRKQRDALDKLNDLDRQNRANSAKLGDIRDRLHDDENPSTKDDLKGYKKDVQAIKDQTENLTKQFENNAAPQSLENTHDQTGVARDSIAAMPTL